MSQHYVSSTEWVSAVLDRARAVGPWPRFDSAAWLRLEPTDIRFVAAVAVAAEAWREDNGTDEAIANRLRLELAAGFEAHDQIFDDEFRRMAAEVRRDANKVSFAVMADRRGDHEKATRARAHAAWMRQTA